MANPPDTLDPDSQTHRIVQPVVLRKRQNIA